MTYTVNHTTSAGLKMRCLRRGSLGEILLHTCMHDKVYIAIILIYMIMSRIYCQPLLYLFISNDMEKEYGGTLKKVKEELIMFSIEGEPLNS